MEVPYSAIKDDVRTQYQFLHGQCRYTPEQTLLAILGDAGATMYPPLEELCVYTSYALLLCEAGAPTAFLAKRFWALAEPWDSVKLQAAMAGETHTFAADLADAKVILSAAP